MVTSLLASTQTSNLYHLHRYAVSTSHNQHRRTCNIRSGGDNSTKETIITPSKRETEPKNVLLKAAWYSSELLGIAASILRSPPSVNVSNPSPKFIPDEEGAISRVAVVETIKEDFQRSYFVTGNLTLDAYEEECEFADPAGSFRGLRRFKRNCTNFGSLIEKSNMKLMKWEDFEDKGIGHWRFSCVLSFPWKPILSGIKRCQAPSFSISFIPASRNSSLQQSSSLPIEKA
ncbi:uncharacterized protein LOC124919420 isoform X2 [Impatiens glandulifera]|uniref:uncharacterized protein LOC124919420 isoform X2 n=1 Tax=Impatiens glandulifera TaxID=253017 RepID=UPI001FB15B5D|nr:uncharacterized protein LOC124919420 isoform X2 [Impatiens glandulifera]